MILIPRQQSPSKEHQSPQRKCNKCNQEPGGPLNKKPQADWAYSCLNSPATGTSRSATQQAMKNLQKRKRKHSHMTLVPRVTGATLAGQAMQTIN
jgi:hypothetical protein